MELNKSYIAGAIAASLSASAFCADKTIFLTFDDGPVNATAEVLDILDEFDIKATFYVNAWHLDGIGDENDDQALANLQRALLSGHVIGNHSYEHMIHNCVDEFGPDSGAECNRTQGWNINSYQNAEVDAASFAKNLRVLKEYLGELAELDNFQADKLARLPYTNDWRVTKDFIASAPCATFDTPERICDQDNLSKSGLISGEVGQLLADQGYKLHGWDLDFWFNFPEPPTQETIEGMLDWYMEGIANSNDTCFHEFYGSFDHPCDHPLRQDKFVLLTHDFGFEDSSRGLGKTVGSELTKELIRRLDAAGYQFDTMDNYLPNWESGRHYLEGDVVSHNGEHYEVVLSHQSTQSWQPDVATTLWSITTPSNQWLAQVDYLQGDAVQYQGQDYQVISAHRSNSAWTPDVAYTLYKAL